jgi:HK97 family phage portal protein
MIAKALGLKRSIQNPAIPLTASGILDYFGIQPTDSGVRVGKNNVLTYSPVWQAVTQLSGDLSKMKLGLYQQDADRMKARVPVQNHRAARLVKKPNNVQNWNKFWRRCWVQALIYNRCYIWIRRTANGLPIEMVCLLSDRTWYVPDADIYATNVGGRDYELFPSEVVSFEGIQFGDGKECELLVNFRESIGLGLAAQGHNARFFGSGGQPGGVLMIPPHFTHKAATNLEEGWRKKYENASAHFRTAILRDGAKWESTAVDAEKSQMHQLRDDQVYEVARWYNMPPSRLGLPGATSYNEKTEDNQNYLDMTLSPWMCALTAELGFKLLTENEQTDHFFLHDTSTLLALNPKLRAETNAIRINSGEINPNESRAESGLPPRPGGDGYRLPSGVLIEGQQTPTDAENTNSRANSRAKELFAQQFDTEIRQCVEKISNRIKKEVVRKTPARFCSWFDEHVDNFAFESSRFVPMIELANELGIHLPELSMGGLFKRRINGIMETHNDDSVQNAVVEACEQIETRVFVEVKP